MKQAKKEKAARQFIESLPLARALSMELRSIGDGEARISMPYDERLIGDPRTGVIHGGAVSTLMDTCGGAAVMSHPQSAGGTATIDLRIDYMRPATPGQKLHAGSAILKVKAPVAAATGRVSSSS